MRIGIFTDTYPPHINGVATSVSMLEQALIKKGHKVYIITINPDNLSYNFEDDHIIRIPGLPTGIYDYRLSGIYPIKAVRRITKLNLDIIHSHTEFGIGLFARILAKQLDIPLVHTYHTMYEDYIYYITKGYFDKSSKKIVEYLTKFYCDKTTTELIVPTKKTYDLFKEKYKFDRNVHIIPTGIDIERFYKEKVSKDKVKDLRKKLNIKEDDFVILFVGRVANEKSIDFLIKNHVSLVKKNKNCKLVIVGSGPDLESLKSLVSKLKITNNVTFTGKVPWNEINLYYNMANVFTTASHTETQGLTVIEAMAASIPVVALDDESFNTTVIPDLNGYLFNTKDEYCKYMNILMSHKDICEKFGRQARISSNQYSSKYYAERVLDVYKLALGGKGSKPNKSFFDKFKSVFKKGLHGK